MKRYFYLFMFIFFAAGLVNAEEQMPNPSAVYAGKLGYKYEVSKEGDGAVIFPDGTKCEGWDFFRAKAGQKWSYCQQHGGKIENRVEDMGTWRAEYAVCVFLDGSECSETDYIDGKSGPGVYKKWSLNSEKLIKFDKPLPTPQN